MMSEDANHDVRPVVQGALLRAGRPTVRHGPPEVPGEAGQGHRTKSYVSCYTRLRLGYKTFQERMTLGGDMANLQGFTAPAVGNMLNHFTRHSGDPEQSKYQYKNSRIDPSRTRLNYAIFEREDPRKFIDLKISKADGTPNKRTNIMSSWIVTLPRNEQLYGREREFFEVAYHHLCEKVGSDNVVGAWVHMDETQPHLHFAFTPCVETQKTTNDKSRPLRWTKRDELKNPEHKAGELKRDKKGTIRYERVVVLDENGCPVTRVTFSQAKMFNQKAMREFHPELSKIMSDHFGFNVGVELDDPGEKSLSSLDQQDYIAAKEAKAKLEEGTKALRGEVDELRDKRDEIKRQISEEAARLESLQQERISTDKRIEVLESIASECRAADSAQVSAKGGILDKIAASCVGFIERVARLLPDSIRQTIKSIENAGMRFGPSIAVVHEVDGGETSFHPSQVPGTDDVPQMQKEKIVVRSRSKSKGF